jgi:hypothetical protein
MPLVSIGIHPFRKLISHPLVILTEPIKIFDLLPMFGPSGLPIEILFNVLRFGSGANLTMSGNWLSVSD